MVVVAIQVPPARLVLLGVKELAARGGIHPLTALSGTHDVRLVRAVAVVVISRWCIGRKDVIYIYEGYVPRALCPSFTTHDHHHQIIEPTHAFWRRSFACVFRHS